MLGRHEKSFVFVPRTLTISASFSLGNFVWAALAIWMACSSGCRSRPMSAVVNGTMDMTGEMNMSGDMNMRGEMKMDGEVATIMRTDNTASRLVSVQVNPSEGVFAGSKICVIDVDGMLVNRNMSGFGSMGENPVSLFREKLEFVASDESIQAIVLRINSSGGGVTATDVMARELERLVVHRRIPVVACIMDVGAGGAYYLACSVDHLVAHPTSLVGGLGVIMNTYNLEDMMGQFGILPIPIKKGDMIDMGTPGRAMAESERAALQSIADELHDRFAQRVQAGRRIQRLPQEILDGKVFTGQYAASLGLVDQVGYLDDAIANARRLAGIHSEAPVVMLRRDRDRAYTVLDVTPNEPTMDSLIPLKVPGLERNSLPTFLYLWQPEPVPF